MDLARASIPINYDEIAEIIRKILTVRDERLREDGSIECEVMETVTLKRDFEKLISRLKPYGYIAMLRRAGNNIILRVAKVEQKEKKTSLLPFILLAATVTTVSIDGFFRTPRIPGYDSTITILLYIAGVMGIIGMHELSHKMAIAKHGMRASLPHFIPGIPGLLPTFGAFISTKDPPINRDSLFDLGLSGPLAGLAITLLVGIGGGLTAIGIPLEAAESLDTVSVTVDIFTELVLNTFTSVPEGYIIILSPLTFAATLGFLITFLNLLPAWQLDGGHIAAAGLSRRQHKIATYISIAILFLLGFTLMAVLVMILSMQTPEARPLDDVSKISSSRRLIFGGVAILAVSLFLLTIDHNPFFQLGFSLQDFISMF